KSNLSFSALSQYIKMESIKMKSTKNTKRTKIDAMRMKDIIAQLTDIIYILCNAKQSNISIILDQFTNITEEELNSLNIFFPMDIDN
ncbi:MAG: hypothetical protein K2H91_01470, partial [Lachnospiraceae bacterium]|nr:hypothetical protein [Lachnospiraceae bacterium]